MLARFYVRLTQLKSSDRTEPQLRNYLHKTGLQASLEAVFLISEWCGQAQLNVGGATPWLVVLGD